MSNVIIRPLVDAKPISDLAHRVRLDLSESEVASRRGFIVRPQSVDEYIRRINVASLGLGAEHKGELVGFALAFDVGTLGSLISMNSSLAEKLLSYAPDTLFLDQIAIDPNSRGIGAGKSLMGEIVANNHGKVISTFVLQKPVQNQASQKFLSGLSWMNAATLVDGSFLWDLYLSPRK